MSQLGPTCGPGEFGHRARIWARAFERVRRRRSVILGYHGVAASRLRDDLSLLQVSPRRFRTQIELLLEAGFRFVTLRELAARAAGGVPEPGMAAVTFDDGMRNNHAVALPILAEYGICASVYVATGFIGGASPWIGPGGDRAMMSEQELRELASAGWELGGHTVNHPDLSSLDYDACRREIDAGRAELERIAEANVDTFAYPFGRYGPAAIAAVRDAGFGAAVTTGSGSWSPYELTRAMVGGADPTALLFLKATDRYEPLLRSAPLRVVRRSSKMARERIRGRLA